MSGRLRFLFTRRWLTYFSCACVFAVACVFLAHWQLSRSQEAAEANARMNANFDADPVALASLLPAVGEYDPGDQWHPVTVTGQYLVEQQHFVRNRPLDGKPGFEVLTPLVTKEGTVFVVDRGWVKQADTGVPAATPAVPDGEVTVVARLRPADSQETNQTATGNLLPRVWPEAIAQNLDRPTYTQAYGVLVTQTPTTQGGPTPLYPAPPLRNEGLHWSYMIQWLIFAVIGFFGLGYGIREEYRRRNQDEDSPQAKAPARRRTRQRRPTDAEIEDAILDGAAESERAPTPGR